MIVGVRPCQIHVMRKKEEEKSIFYIHIKHLVDTNNEVKSLQTTVRHQNGNSEPNQLN
jgi:hypothetical protein